MKNNPKQLIYLDDTAESDPRVKCGACGHESRLLEDFSLLKAGFNGIKSGDSNDLDLQECGRCGAKLEW